MIQKPVVVRWFLGFIITSILLFATYTWLTLHWSYSSGERAGYVQKFSHKGWLCKTWEGELAMVSMPGTMSEKFQFSVTDDAVSDKINKNLGKRVSLTYEQHVGVPSTCFAETQYFVTDVRVVE
ncbi:MAG: hypothetical protein WC426_07405 [Sulfuriferula sp.]